jgi:uncharacterized caspase-like protein
MLKIKQLTSLVFALFALAWLSPAEARRAALIIGNSAYTSTSPLPNPGNDAKLVADAARKAGFDITLVTDIARADFDKALRDFRAQADGAEVALIYYAGHGIESGGKNWLIPVDAKLAESRDLRFEAIELDGLLETLNNAQRRVVILDACRNNPFGNNWSSGVRSVPRGLAATEIEGALVIYAASGGQVATDGTDGNSPFALAIAKRLPEPGLLLQMLGPKVTDDVVATTGGVQRPWTNSGMGGQEYYLVPPVTSSPANSSVAQSSASEAGSGSADAYAWRYADKSNTAEDYADYLKKFPNGVFEKDARERLARLGVTVPVPAQPAPAPIAAPVADTPAPSQQPAASVKLVEAAAPAAGPTEPTAAPKLVGPVAAPEPAQTLAPAEAAKAIAVATPSTSQTAGVVQPASGGKFLSQAIKLNDLEPLPAIPAAPQFTRDGYPDCRERYQAYADSYGKASEITRCLSVYNDYYVSGLSGYRAKMIRHQEEVSKLYLDKVARQGKYTPESQDQFYRAMLKEHAAASPEGDYFADFRVIEKRYQEDRAYLEDRYCFSTGTCKGYPVPGPVPAIKK